MEFAEAESLESDEGGNIRLHLPGSETLHLMNLKANLTETIGRSVLIEIIPVCLPEKESKFTLPQVAGKVLAEQDGPSR